MIETQQDSMAALRVGKPWCEIIPEADGSVDEWDSAMLCGSYSPSGPVEPELLRMRLYAAGTFEAVS